MSFSLDFESILNNASTIFNSLFPILAWPLGITVGVALIGIVMSAIQKAIR